jgi:pyridoxine kinase
MPSPSSSSCSKGSRVLSIQSHVVHGYVGNKAAVFPLQLLGFDVDVVNSVHFSNHTGYAAFKGDVLQGHQLLGILNGLNGNGLLKSVGHVLTGYIGSESFLNAVLSVVTEIRNDHPCRFVCDPVLGDGGKFYVPQELVQVYRDKVIPMADVVTPNQFEVEQLTGVEIHQLEDAKRACDILHDMGPSLVFITSMVLSPDVITILASHRVDTTTTHVWSIESPLVDGHFTGTGDLCASLLLGHTALNPDDLAGVMEKVSSTMHAVIQRTHAQHDGSVASRELKLVQSKGDIENPTILFSAKRIS